MRAWRTATGTVSLGKELPDADQLLIPCGGCLGCRQSRAREWTLRCHLELHNHDSAVFTTLTYDDAYLPPTLQKRELSLWLKRLRRLQGENSRIRFFASGEYGELNARPHYHALLYGISENEHQAIDAAWQRGWTKTDPITPARIAYVAGYCSKKIGFKQHATECVDPKTGEVMTWEPPFVHMSRNPGIGGQARKWPNSWRDHAVLNGHHIPVPRFYHEAYKQQATQEDLENLKLEKMKKAITRGTSEERRRAAEQRLIARQQIAASKRKY